MPLMTTGAGIYPAIGGGGGGSVTWSYKTSATGGGGSSVTLSSMAIGTTVSSDIVVVMVACDNANPNSVSVGGNAATAVSGAADGASVDSLSFWYVSGVTLSSTSSVVVGSAGTMFNVGAFVGVISGSATPTPSSGTAITPSFADPFSISQSVPSGGVALVGLAAGASLTGSWTAATQDGSLNRGGGSVFDYFAHTANGTGSSINATHPTGGNQNHGIMAVWGP